MTHCDPGPFFLSRFGFKPPAGLSMPWLRVCLGVPAVPGGMQPLPQLLLHHYWG